MENKKYNILINYLNTGRFDESSFLSGKNGLLPNIEDFNPNQEIILWDKSVTNIISFLWDIFPRHKSFLNLLHSQYEIDMDFQKKDTYRNTTGFAYSKPLFILIFDKIFKKNSFKEMNEIIFAMNIFSNINFDLINKKYYYHDLSKKEFQGLDNHCIYSENNMDYIKLMTKVELIKNDEIKDLLSNKEFYQLYNRFINKINFLKEINL